MTEYKTDLHLYSFPPSGPVCLHTPTSFSRRPSSFSFSHFPYYHLLHVWHSLTMRLNSILMGSTGKLQLWTALFCKAETFTGLSLLSLMVRDCNGGCVFKYLLNSKNVQYLKVNPSVNYGLWLMMCQCPFIFCNKCTILMGDVDNERGYGYVRAGAIWEISVLSTQFCREP